MCPRCNNKVLGNKPYCERCKIFFDLESRKKITKGKCLYCSYEGVLSQEHVLPDWLSNAFPPHSRKSYKILERPDFMDFSRRSHVNRKFYSQNKAIYDSKVYNVCRECNNGWMSNLQNIAKPFVISLGRGNGIILLLCNNLYCLDGLQWFLSICTLN